MSAANKIWMPGPYSVSVAFDPSDILTRPAHKSVIFFPHLYWPSSIFIERKCIDTSTCTFKHLTYFFLCFTWMLLLISCLVLCKQQALIRLIVAV